MALRAASTDDLKRLADADHVEVSDAAGPGGGRKVSLIDPNGYVEVIASRTPAPERPHGVRAPWNTFAARARPGAAKRINPGPASVVRLGHVVRGSRPDGALAAGFIRCDRGDDPADHHSLNFAVIPGKPPGFHHAAFEVADLDDLMLATSISKSNDISTTGVGRHILGSQVFEHWKNPFGHPVEHWTDGDMFTADFPTKVTDVATMLAHQWGPAAPAEFA